MDNDQTKAMIASAVAEKSADFYDKVIELARRMGYEVIRSSIIGNNPTSINVAIDPINVLRVVLEKMETSKLKKSLTKKDKDYVLVEELVDVKDGRDC